MIVGMMTNCLRPGLRSVISESHHMRNVPSMIEINIMFGQMYRCLIGINRKRNIWLGYWRMETRNG
jgi:hypothetical protein